MGRGEGVRVSTGDGRKTEIQRDSSKQIIQTYICTHTHTHTRARTHARVHTHARARVHTHTHLWCRHQNHSIRIQPFDVLDNCYVLITCSCTSTEVQQNLPLQWTSDSGLSRIKTQYNKPLYKGHDLWSQYNSYNTF